MFSLKWLHANISVFVRSFSFFVFIFSSESNKVRSTECFCFWYSNKISICRWLFRFNFSFVFFTWLCLGTVFNVCYVGHNLCHIVVCFLEQNNIHDTISFQFAIVCIYLCTKIYNYMCILIDVFFFFRSLSPFEIIIIILFGCGILCMLFVKM